MKLTEFDLWAFKLELSEAREFTLFCRCVCAHFERYFQPIQTEGIYRIIVKLSDPDPRIGTTEVSSSVLKYYKKFDFDLFNSLEIVPRKKVLLNLLYESLIELCEINNWSKVNFKNAYDSVISENFLNTYIIKKKASRNRMHSAKLVGMHTEESFKCYIKIENKEGAEILNQLLFSELPDEFLFNGQVGDIKWLSEKTVVHINKNKKELARFEI